MEKYLTNDKVTLIKEDDHYLIIHKNINFGNIKIANEYVKSLSILIIKVSTMLPMHYTY